MRRLSGVVLAGAILMLPAFAHNAGVQAQALRSSRWRATSRCGAWPSARTRPPTSRRFSAESRKRSASPAAPEAKQQLAGVAGGQDGEADARRQHHLHPRHHAGRRARTTTSSRCCTRRSLTRRSRRSSTSMYRGAFAANLGIVDRHGRRRTCPSSAVRAAAVGSSHERADRSWLCVVFRRPECRSWKDQR